MSVTLKNSPSQFSYSLCNAQLDGACHQKYLGVYITFMLSWQLQCDDTKKKGYESFEDPSKESLIVRSIG